MLRQGGELDGHRVLSPGMIDFCTRNHTGDRDWVFYPANLGVGFFMRGEGNLTGLFSVMNSPKTYGGFGTGTTGFTVDPERDLTLSFLSTGLMEDSYHFERMGVMATLVLAAMIE